MRVQIPQFSTLATVTAAALVSLSCVSNAHAEVNYRYYVNAGTYGYNILHMPDFDQRRMQVGEVSGLPNNGSMYCAPTSIMNICAYIADHGYPSVPPEDYNWQSSRHWGPELQRAEQSASLDVNSARQQPR